MEDVTSSKLALRSLLKDSKEKRASSVLIDAQPKVKGIHQVPLTEIPETDEKRKEQISER